jgi:hypothetical protein
MLSRLRSAAGAALVLAACAPLAAQTSDPLAATNVALRHAPARVGGLWCGAGLLHEFSLEIAQHYQDLTGKLTRKGRVREITGHVDGATVRTDPQRNESLELQAQSDELRVTGGTGPLALLRGQSFTRAAGDSCTD